MRKATENMTREERRAYYATRKPFLPEIGATYENEGGGEFIVLDSIRHGVVDGRAHAVVMNTRSRWVCTAHGVGIYEDGAIDWDGSTDGYFDDEEAHEVVKWREFETRHEIDEAKAAIRELPDVPRGDLLPLAGMYPTYAADLLRDLVEGNDSPAARRVRRAARELEKIAAKY